jgi:hypothetical protein
MFAFADASLTGQARLCSASNRGYDDGTSARLPYMEERRHWGITKQPHRSNRRSACGVNAV